MNSDKVLLAVLKERQSAKGNRYLSGWLGKARLIAFQDKDAPEGEVIWQVYAQTPEDREQPGQQQRRPSVRDDRSRRQPAPLSADELNDEVPW
jgi:hypothetical protein